MKNSAVIKILGIWLMSSSISVAASLGPISDETPPAICNPGWFVSELQCKGRYCDKLSIKCQQVPGAQITDASWTAWVSEEKGGRQSCPSPNSYLAGLACRGSYCDKVSLYCVQINNAQSQSCAMTKTFSEENGGKLSLFLGDKSGQRFLGNMLQCKGRYCDKKSFQSCQVELR